MNAPRINNDFIEKIAIALLGIGVNSYYVGGCVRDKFLGVESDDIDVCLVGAPNVQTIDRFLNSFGIAKYVGESFPVWKITDSEGNEYDFALARTERKVGQNRQDFAVHFDDSVSIEDDLRRRDLTVNAIAINVVSGEVIDPFGGINDLCNKIARPVSEAFAEDTLRIYRAARFIARFNLSPAPELVSVCRNLMPIGISNERVGMELDKLVKQSNTPSMFFQFLKNVGWLGYHFHELDTLVGVQQNPKYHPEGDAFEHTMHCMDAANTPFMRIVMMCHDLGKATTTVLDKGNWKAPGHACAGIEPTLNMLKRIKFKDGKYQNKVACLVENHMFHVMPEFSRRAVGRMVNRLAEVGLSFDDLVEVCRCDLAGRPPIEPIEPYIGQDLAEGFEVQGERIEPIVSGHMLIEKGIAPGPELGRIKSELLDLQLSGELNEENWEEFLEKVR